MNDQDGQDWRDSARPGILRPFPMSTLRVTLWNEYVHERRHPAVAAIYPEGIHGALASALRRDPVLEVRTATLDQPGQGLPQELLDETDVLLWWGHAAHDQVEDALVTRIQRRVLDGMGLVVLHSGHYSKLFKRMMGTGCGLRWREAGERERIWCVNPGHPIAEGVGDWIEIEHGEMYGEPFDVPEPDEVVFISWFQGGEVFRSGCTWRRGGGRIFYFSPGHESYPIYHRPEIQRVITNAVHWARPRGRPSPVPLHVPADQAREPLTPRGPAVHDPSGRLPTP